MVGLLATSSKRAYATPMWMWFGAFPGAFGLGRPRAGALGAVDLGMAKAPLEEVAINPTTEPPELTQDWEILPTVPLLDQPPAQPGPPRVAPGRSTDGETRSQTVQQPVQVTPVDCLIPWAKPLITGTPSCSKLFSSTSKKE